MNFFRKRVAWALACLTLLGLGLRLWNIAAEPYWGDEILSLDIVTHFSSVSEMMRYLSLVEFHPPLYYLMLRPWVAAFGSGEVATRSLSLVFSVAAIPLIYKIARSLFSGRRGKITGLVAAGMFAVLPLQIEYGQEARPYAIFCFFGILAAMAAWEYRQREQKVWLAAYVLASAIGFLLHFSYVFLLVATAGWWLIDALRSDGSRRSRGLIVWLAAHAAISFLAYASLATILYKLFLGTYPLFGEMRGFYAERPPEHFLRIIDRSIWTTKSISLPMVLLFGKFAAYLASFAAFYAVIKQSGRDAPTESDNRPLAYLAWLFTVPLLLFALSPQSVAYAPIVERHIIFITVPVALICGYVASRISLRHAAAVGSILLASLIPFIANIIGNDADWDSAHRLREAGEYINENFHEGDLVIVAMAFSRSDIAHYLRPEIPLVSVLPVAVFEQDVWRSRTTLGVLENEAQVRIRKPSTEEVRQKLDRLVSLHKPQRVWLYDFVQKDTAVYDWFSDRKWRHAIKNVADLFRVDLYVAP